MWMRCDYSPIYFRLQYSVANIGMISAAAPNTDFVICIPQLAGGTTLVFHKEI